MDDGKVWYDLIAEILINAHQKIQLNMPYFKEHVIKKRCIKQWIPSEEIVQDNKKRLIYRDIFIRSHFHVSTLQPTELGQIKKNTTKANINNSLESNE